MTHDRSDAEDAEEGWNIDPRKLTPHDWFEIFQTQPPCHGAADLFTYGPDPELDRASAFVVATRGLQEESASSAFFAKTVVVLPPDAPDDAAVVARIARWTKRPDAVTRAIAQVVEFRRVTSFDSSALAAALRDLPARSAVIIVSAGVYRSREASGSRQIDEDRWVPHTVIAARIAVAHAKAAECYVALSVT